MSLLDPMESVLVRGSEANSPPASATPLIAKLYLIIILFSFALVFATSFYAALYALTFAALGGLVIGLRYPSLGLLSAVVLCSLDPMSRTLIFKGGLLRWNTLNYLFLILILVNLRTIFSRRTTQSVLLAAFAALLAVYLLPSPDPPEGIQHILGVLAFFALQALYVNADGGAEKYYWAGLVGGVVGAVGGGVYFLMRRSLPEINDNAWAFFPLTCLFGLVLAAPSCGSRRQFATVMVLGLVNYAWVFLSGSRSGLLSATFCLAFLLATTPGLSQKLLAASFGTLLALIVSSVFTELQEYTLHRLEKTLDSQHHTVTDRASGRDQLMLAGLLIFLDHPLGVGTGGFEKAYAEGGTFGGEIHFKTGKEFSAHAGWVLVLAETGLAGFVPLAAFVLSYFRVSRHAPRPWRGTGLFVAAVLIATLFFTEFQGKGLWLLSAGTSTLFYDLYPGPGRVRC